MGFVTLTNEQTDNFLSVLVPSGWNGTLACRIYNAKRVFSTSDILLSTQAEMMDPIQVTGNWTNLAAVSLARGDLDTYSQATYASIASINRLPTEEIAPTNLLLVDCPSWSTGCLSPQNPLRTRIYWELISQL
jgi:hypothetical protein